MVIDANPAGFVYTGQGGWANSRGIIVKLDKRGLSKVEIIDARPEPKTMPLDIRSIQFGGDDGEGRPNTINVYENGKFVASSIVNIFASGRPSTVVDAEMLRLHQTNEKRLHEHITKKKDHSAVVRMTHFMQHAVSITGTTNFVLTGTYSDPETALLRISPHHTGKNSQVEIDNLPRCMTAMVAATRSVFCGFCTDDGAIYQIPISGLEKSTSESSFVNAVAGMLLRDRSSDLSRQVISWSLSEAEANEKKLKLAWTEHFEPLFISRAAGGVLSSSSQISIWAPCVKDNRWGTTHFGNYQSEDVAVDDKRLWADIPTSGGYILYTVPSQGRPIEPALVVKASDAPPGSLAPPEDFVYRGQLDEEFSMWTPIPPPGYVALGNVLVGRFYDNKKPTAADFPRFRCVRTDFLHFFPDTAAFPDDLRWSTALHRVAEDAANRATPAVYTVRMPVDKLLRPVYRKAWGEFSVDEKQQLEVLGFDHESTWNAATEHDRRNAWARWPKFSMMTRPQRCAVLALGFDSEEEYERMRAELIEDGSRGGATLAHIPLPSGHGSGYGGSDRSLNGEFDDVRSVASTRLSHGTRNSGGLGHAPALHALHALHVGRSAPPGGSYEKDETAAGGSSSNAMRHLQIDKSFTFDHDRTELVPLRDTLSLRPEAHEFCFMLFEWLEHRQLLEYMLIWRHNILERSDAPRAAAIAAATAKQAMLSARACAFLAVSYVDFRFRELNYYTETVYMVDFILGGTEVRRKLQSTCCPCCAPADTKGSGSCCSFFFCCCKRSSGKEDDRRIAPITIDLRLLCSDHYVADAHRSARKGHESMGQYGRGTAPATASPHRLKYLALVGPPDDTFVLQHAEVEFFSVQSESDGWRGEWTKRTASDSQIAAKSAKGPVMVLGKQGKGQGELSRTFITKVPVDFDHHQLQTITVEGYAPFQQAKVFDLSSAAADGINGYRWRPNPNAKSDYEENEEMPSQWMLVGKESSNSAWQVIDDYTAPLCYGWIDYSSENIYGERPWLPTGHHAELNGLYEHADYLPELHTIWEQWVACGQKDQYGIEYPYGEKYPTIAPLYGANGWLGGGIVRQTLLHTAAQPAIGMSNLDVVLQQNQVASELQSRERASFLYENHAGGGTRIGTTPAKSANADGYLSPGVRFSNAGMTQRGGPVAVVELQDAGGGRPTRWDFHQGVERGISAEEELRVMETGDRGIGLGGARGISTDLVQTLLKPEWNLTRRGTKVPLDRLVLRSQNVRSQSSLHDTSLGIQLDPAINAVAGARRGEVAYRKGGQAVMSKGSVVGFGVGVGFGAGIGGLKGMSSCVDESLMGAGGAVVSGPDGAVVSGGDGRNGYYDTAGVWQGTRYEDIGPVVINVRTHYKRKDEALVACNGFLKGIQIGDKLTGINDVGLAVWVDYALHDPRNKSAFDTVDALLRYVARLPDAEVQKVMAGASSGIGEDGTSVLSGGTGRLTDGTLGGVVGLAKSLWLNLNGIPADSIFNGVYKQMNRAEQLQKLQVECMHRIGLQAPDVRIDLINRHILFLKDVHFHGDCARIVEADAELVQQLAMVARTVQEVCEEHCEPPFHFVVEGHVNPSSLSQGTNGANGFVNTHDDEQLSLLRAEAIARRLRAMAGTKKYCLHPIGLGCSRPISTARGAAAEERNRRVEIRVLTEEEALVGPAGNFIEQSRQQLRHYNGMNAQTQGYQSTYILEETSERYGAAPAGDTFHMPNQAYSPNFSVSHCEGADQVRHRACATA
jgi:outer membrane protein OmpA-like peptidoglycan-associated protein